MPGIIVGIDGSDHARKALEWAVDEATRRQAPLTVFTVNPAVAGFWGPTPPPGDLEFTERARKAAQEETDFVLAKLAAGSRPPMVTVRAVTGMPAEVLLEAGADADMIVVGSRGAGGFRRMLMGSVSSQVAQHSRRPVVIIPSRAD